MLNGIDIKHHLRDEKISTCSTHSNNWIHEHYFWFIEECLDVGARRLGQDIWRKISSCKGKPEDRKHNIQLYRDCYGQEPMLVISQGWICPTLALKFNSTIFSGILVFKIMLQHQYYNIYSWKISHPISVKYKIWYGFASLYGAFYLPNNLGNRLET